MYTPILLHFEKPQKHFTLFIGSYGQYIFLSDPSIGVHFIDNNEFDSKFSGYALFIYGKDELKRWDVIHSINSQLQQKIDYLYLLSNISYRWLQKKEQIAIKDKRNINANELDITKLI